MLRLIVGLLVLSWLSLHELRELRFEQLKRETFAAPAPETMEKEKQMTSMKNITFLFIGEIPIRTKHS